MASLPWTWGTKGWSATPILPKGSTVAVTGGGLGSVTIQVTLNEQWEVLPLEDPPKDWTPQETRKLRANFFNPNKLAVIQNTGCPACMVGKNQPCVTAKGKVRNQSHAPRVLAWRVICFGKCPSYVTSKEFGRLREGGPWTFTEAL